MKRHPGDPFKLHRDADMKFIRKAYAQSERKMTRVLCVGGCADGKTTELDFPTKSVRVPRHVPASYRYDEPMRPDAAGYITYDEDAYRAEAFTGPNIAEPIRIYVQTDLTLPEALVKLIEGYNP